MLIMLLTLGVGQMWGAAKQRYIYCGISNTLENNKNNSQFGFNFWGGTSGGVKSATWIQDLEHDGRNYHVYRVQVYDDNNKAQAKIHDSWWEPGSGTSVTLNGTNNNAVFFSHSNDGWGGQFQRDFQVTSTASLSASSSTVATGTTVTLTPSLSTNSTYNEIKSTSYSVTTNPNSAGTVTSAGKFSATRPGTYTVTATVTYNAKDFSGITNTATATSTIVVYGTFSAGTTVVWDLCGNEKSWDASYLYKELTGGSTSNDAMTQCGSTTQYRKNYADAVSNVKVFLFRAQNGSTWSDYKQTTDIYRDVSGVTLYEFDNTLDGKKLNWQVTTGAKKATSGTKVYFDNTDAGWSEIWLKYGTSRFNRHTGSAATKVTGTQNLYVITMPEAYYVNWYFASSYGWTSRNNINDTHVGKRIPIQSTDLTSDITFVPSGSTSGSSPTQYATTSFSGHTRTLTFGSHTNGNITVRYTDENGDEQTVSSADVSSVDVAQTCQVVITAVPNSGYAPSGLTLGGSPITSGATQTIRADGTIVATFVEEETHDVTVSYMYGTRSLHDAQEFEVGITTASDISAEEIDGFSFSAWSDLTNVTNNTGNLTTNPININTIEDGDDGSMVCNYTPWTCSLDVVTSENATTYSSRTAMSYDATTKAYYKNFTTTASTQYFRFYINSIEYAPSSNTEVVITGTKVTANTNVTGYASNKPSVYFNDGGSGSNITVWFDYENKQAWVTEQKHTVTISAGSHGSVSPTSVSVGNVVASSTITATASDHYHWASWSVPSGVTIASGSGTRQITIKATADDKEITANFAGDVYTITYRDQGDVAFSGSQTTPPTTHTYGTATTLKIPTKTGYDFGGWFTASNCASGAVGNTSAASLGATAFTGNITLYAKWTAKSYSTSNNIKNADGSNAGTYTATYDATSIALNSTPSKTGYNITNYYKESSFTTLIANTNLSLTSAATTYTSGGKWKCTSAPDLYVKWQAKTYTVTLDDNGDYTSNGSATATYDSNTLTSITAPRRTGYSPEGYYTNAACTTKVATPAGALQASTTYTTSGSLWSTDDDATLYTKWTANKYTVTLNPGTGGSGSGTMEIYYDAAGYDTWSHDITQTGYHIAGWYYNAGSLKVLNANGTFADDDVENYITDGKWTKAADCELQAWWDPNGYTVTLDKQTEAEGYSASGTVGNQDVAYNTALPSMAGSTAPTAANGYAFMGFYTEEGGEGLKVINANLTWVASVAGYTNGSSQWIHDGNVTLYAYYKKAEITALTLDAAIVETNATVGVTPTVSPTPTGNTKLCFYVFHSNDNPLSPQPEISWNGTKATFDAGAVSGTYKVGVSLRTGTACGGGTLLDSTIIEYQVAGSHTVTVNYKCGDDVIKAATSLEGIRPLDWSDDITAPDIFGYTFSSWSSADGVTIKDSENEDVTSSTEATIKIKATYAGSLTANYTQNQMIFFKNTLGWSDVYVNFYTTSHWNNPKGSGNQGVTNRNKHMTQLDDTDIWYYDYGAASITPSLYVSFTSASQDGSEFFWKSGGVNVVYPANYPDAINTDKSSETGFKAATPMFVPLATQDKVTLNSSSGGKADYYNAGYWTKYTPGTGYRLEIYNNGTGAFIKAQDFTSADDLMPMKATVDLEGGTTYKFQLRRGGESSAGIYYGNSGTMTYADHGQGTPWDMTNGSFSMCRITTNAAGDYTFNLSYSGNSSTPPHYRLRMAVDYPVADGDYRLVYSDAVQTKEIKSAIVTKKNDGSDIVSFFVRSGSTPVLRIQQATVDGKTGAITWKEYPTDGTPTNQITGTVASAISSGGTEVYNFNLSMNGSGALSVASAEIYEGNFYIRTDAANSKWDNYRTDPDHVMTYSEYSITHGGYTHYYTHWVDKDDVGRKNVKFVIANDYSPNISDTLARETASGTWTNISDFMEAGGDLKRSANVRFMWNKSDNSISRAYIDGAQEDGSEFLTIQSSDSKIKNAAGDATLTQVTFSDNGNWMYEANIKAQPTAQIKLLSKWGTSNIITQYFRGGAESTETLIGGSGSNWYDIRLIYDFKTNRMIAGLIPSGNIEDPMAINADVMFVREHHGDIAQLTFTDDGAITDIKTAFGVLQFNKWTINNKSKESGHSPLSPLLSRYERDLFYVSFPFKVAMEDVFGFGTYGQHWIIEEYDGASRAANGYWLESGPNWKFVTNRKNKYFEPGQGYIIALDLDEMGESSSVWANTDQVELYFPSYGTMDNITSSTATYNIPEHLCTINRTVDASGNPTGLPADYDRRVKDSHWNVLGVPTYVNPDAPNFANTKWTTSATETSIGPNFLYEWNMTDNSVSAVSASGYTYHAMHAYLVQYCGDVTWTSSVSVEPSSIVARRTSAERPQSVEFRLQMQQNDVTVDQTFVKLSDDEAVTTGFEFNYDLSKEFNKNRSNIYTFIGTEQVAGNVLPMSEQTTVVPVGVIAKTTGDYTFAIPEGTEGIGVTLIDNETGIRTSLSALTYTVNLEAGTYNERFVLEISPISQVLTDIDNVQSDDVQGTKAHKVMIDGLLYIVKDGVMYDARGARVE